MRLGFTLAGVVILCMIGLLAVIDGSNVLPQRSALVVGVIVFWSCVTGMMIVYIDLQYASARRARHRRTARLRWRECAPAHPAAPSRRPA